MKVLVTGGTGLVGSHSVKAILDAGHDVRLSYAPRVESRRRSSRSVCAMWSIWWVTLPTQSRCAGRWTDATP